MKKNERKLETHDKVKVGTDNAFITARELPNLTLKARKLLLIAIAQCKMNDSQFYCYSISVQDFSKLMGIASTNVYQTADSITDELLKAIIRIDYGDGNGFKKTPLFAECEYKNGIISFELNPRMNKSLLGLKGNFTQPLLNDFMRMKSQYTIQIWHLMQREMKSKKPKGITEKIEFDLSLQELRIVTGTENKLTTIGNFKNRILNRSIDEIEINCGVRITYDNIKDGKTVIGFHFKVVNLVHLDIKDIPVSEQERIKQKAAELNAK